MKLLFDENLSPKLPGLLADIFPGSIHIRECAMKGRSDGEVWEFARLSGFTLVSKDPDFQQRSMLYGHPPKLVWLRIGNCTRERLAQLITTHARDIFALDAELSESMLVLS